MKIGDSHYGEWRDRLGLQTTDKQDWACLALEGAGQRFLVDFGYENAIEKVLEMRRQRLCGAPGYPIRNRHKERTAQ